MDEMEWEDVDPMVKTVPWATAWVTVNKDAKPRLCMGLSEATMNECGRPTAANIAIGTKDGKALVRLVFDPAGKFKVTEMEKGGGRVHGIPIKAPIPDGARDKESCDPIKKTKIEAIFELPLEAWQKQLDGAKPATVAPVHVAKPAAPAAPNKPGAKLIAVDYLRSKGVQISKLAGDWWQMAGNKVPRMEVLARVNKIRRASDLKPLGMDQIE